MSLKIVAIYLKRRQTTTNNIIIVIKYDILEEIAFFQTNNSINLFKNRENKAKNKEESFLIIIRTNLIYNYIYQIKLIRLKS